MALFGSSRDISVFKHINRELLDDIIQQEVDYYKYYLPETKNGDVENLYGEASAQKTYYTPVRVTCLLERGDQTYVQDDQIGIDVPQTMTFRFFKPRLIELGLESGMIMAPKTKGAMQIRFSSKIFKDPTISGDLIFPNLTKKDYEDFLIGDDDTTRTIQTLDAFGRKYGINGLGRQLPQDVVMDLAKSESFITDMSFILGKKE